MMIRCAIMSGNNVYNITNVDDADLIYFPPGYLISLEGRYEVQKGWIYDPITDTFSPNWTLEQSDALDAMKITSRGARLMMTRSGVEHDTSEEAQGRLAFRIQAREERGDLSTDTEAWRLRNETFVDQSLADDKALLVSMYEHVQDCEDAYRTAQANVVAACDAQDLAALAIAKNPTWPT